MLTDSFWNKVQVGQIDKCWPWLACLCGGYGHVRINGKVLKAHRLSYEAEYGPIPNGKIVMHICDNRACVNPNHLRLGTVYDNNKDRDNKGRQVARAGEQHGMSKLTRSGITEIRKLQAKHAVERDAIANKLGVSSSTVFDVMRGKTWRDV